MPRNRLDSFTPVPIGLSALIHSLPLTQSTGLPLQVAASPPRSIPIYVARVPAAPFDEATARQEPLRMHRSGPGAGTSRHRRYHIRESRISVQPQTVFG